VNTDTIITTTKFNGNNRRCGLDSSGSEWGSQVVSYAEPSGFIKDHNFLNS
jgi:hypothetical protein